MANCSCERIMTLLVRDDKSFSDIGEEYRCTMMARQANKCEVHADMFNHYARSGLAKCFLNSLEEYVSRISWMRGHKWKIYELSARVADDYINIISSRGETMDGDQTYSSLVGMVIQLLPLRFVASFAQNRDYWEREIRMLYRKSEDVFILSQWCKVPLPLPKNDCAA